MNRIVFAALFLLASGPLAAENGSGLFSKESWQDGFYFGAGAAFLRIDTKLSSTGLAPAESISGSDSFTKTSIASKFFGGYRFIRYAGIEGGYFKAYDVEDSYCFTEANGECTESRGGVVSSSDWSVELPTSGFTLAATGFLPINDTIELMIKVGGVNAKVDGLAQEDIVGGFVPVKPPAVPALNSPINRKVKNSGWDVMGAFGVDFNSESGVTIRAEVEYFNIKEIDEPWLISLNALYNF